MIKRFFVISILISTFLGLNAQPYGNEWIDYSQKYYKVKITQQGIYRFNLATLTAAGIPSNIDPRNIQLFNKGEEQYIYVEGESDGIFNSSDYIEFYANKNDGEIDSALYKNTSFVPNPYYSLVNDTAVYFLTWNSSTANKRMAIGTDVNFNLYAPSAYFIHEEVYASSAAYYAGETDRAGGTNAAYSESEGYFDARVLTYGNSLTYGISTHNIYAPGPKATIEIVMVGASKDIGFTSQYIPDHRLGIYLKKRSTAVYPTTPLTDTLFIGYSSNKFVYNVDPTALGTTATDFRFNSLRNSNYISNRTVLSYISIRYPHTFNLQAKTDLLMTIPYPPSQVNAYLNISNFSASGIVRVYDLLNGARVDAVLSGGNYNVLMPRSSVAGDDMKCFISSEGRVVNIASLTPVSTSAQFVDYSAFAADSAYIIVTNNVLSTAANDYKNYRSTNIYGGLHNVVVADIDQLYDQFAFGIVKSPLSIRNFSDYLLDTYPSPPQNLFIIGKAIHLRLCRQNRTNYANCLVPSFGNPSSDNLLTAGLNGTILEPAIPIGRLAAKNNNDVSVYLTKVMEYEDQLNNPPAAWKKKVLHFGGGKSDYEQNTFKTYLQSYQDTIESMNYGAEVTEFYKTNSAPIQINSSDNLRNIINNGVALTTFFGHGSATTGFDQSIDDVNAYDPIRGHYPILLANGCFVGDIHSTTLSSSETYLLTPSKGFIAYIGTVGLGIPYALNIYSQEFYNQFARKNYNKSLGSTIQKTVQTIQSGAANDALVGAVCNEMNLHGDPSLRIGMYDKPDYKITSDKIYFDTTTEIDSFAVYIVRTNIGMHTNDTIITTLIRTLPNGETEEFIMSGAAPGFRDTISFKLAVNLTDGVGLNKFTVILDSYNEVDEENESNNTVTGVNLIIEGVGILPVYPYQFAIVANDKITLRGVTINPLAAAGNYIFQFDTTDLFNSPLMLSTVINSPGGVVSWEPPITFVDSTVYYWRVSTDSTTTNDYLWREKSFQYIQNKTGWAQAHFFQFKDNDYSYVNYNRPQRKYDFVNDLKTVQCHDGIFFSSAGYYTIEWSLNNTKKQIWHCNARNPSFTLAVISNIDGENMVSPPVVNPASNGHTGIYGNSHCNSSVRNTFDFLMNTPADRAYLIDFINNTVPDGSYVLAYSMNQVNYGGIEEAFFQAFESLGSSQIRTIPASRPYILFGKKGTPATPTTIGAATELVGNSLNEILDLNTTFTTNFDNGTISSPEIGPALSWGSFHWQQHNADDPNLGNADNIEIQLIGIKADGTESTLVVFPKDSTDVLNLSAYVDAAIYPKIRLVASMKDDALHTPPQMDRWQVIYAEVPEGAISPSLGYYISADVLQAGESVEIHLPFQNISETAFPDSLLFTYWNQDATGNRTILLSSIKKSLLAPNEVIIDTINISTTNYIGLNALWVEVNPVNQPNSQLEKYHFNNIMSIPLAVSSDNINPLLDVTFDGIHILNKDIVSAKPNILIKLKDENQFLALNDTNDFKIFIQGASDIAARRIHFGDLMTFTPALLPDNSCQINYTPTFIDDGIYQLIVQAQDKSANQSGAIDYVISFEVINKSTITEVMNYPNPFSTSTRFVFTLTGSEIPTYFKIQIITITGKVVREITHDELGPIHVGRNITEYAWNGKDEFGDQLANGVYLYRVVTTIRATKIEKRKTGADKHFEKGFGKMYLMR